MDFPEGSAWRFLGNREMRKARATSPPGLGAKKKARGRGEPEGRIIFIGEKLGLSQAGGDRTSAILGPGSATEGV